ncbi:DUF3068 domain-containing protein [Actinocrinis puniceicyclus]|uniref:DUF3068 domain-containing protein n=1 Tax=Actinocrinis puniceicyclus TaxID=977794 RepID=A0A8J7WTX0_9ACTN|nr:porin PorA family protein [Actinocrinis puniceicyclus]MBS2966402.1 DUF3068 domain-containing protein [Actinocrinis puniceicyclus]
MRRSSIVLLVVGALLLAAAGVLRFAVYPQIDRLPSNYDRTATYSGSGSFLNPAAIASGNAANALLIDQPVTVTRRAKVTGTSGSTAVVSDQLTARLRNGTTVLSNVHVWAIDRGSMDAAPAPGGASADPHQGLTIGFPIGVQQRTYAYWDAGTQQAVPALFQRAEAFRGRSADVFTVTASGPLKDPKLLAALPASLPTSVLGAVASLLPPNVQSLLKSLGPALPAALALSYTSTTKLTGWIDAGTGLPLDVRQQQTVVAGLSLAGTTQPVLPVISYSIENTNDSINQAVHDATSAGVTLTLLGVTAPLVLLVLGVLVIAWAVWAALRPRRRPAASAGVSGAPAGGPRAPDSPDPPAGAPPV